MPPPNERKGGDVSVVSSDYFRTMGIPILAGREFDRRDYMGSPGVAILNREAVRMLFGEEDPIGKRLRVMWAVRRMWKSSESPRISATLA